MGDDCKCEQASLARFEERRRGIGIAGIVFGVAAGMLIPVGIKKVSTATAYYQGGIGCALASLIMTTSWIALGDHRRIVNVEGYEREQTAMMAAFDELAIRRMK